jgi:PadR family transcriptional regulator, regulatory protein PadR
MADPDKSSQRLLSGFIRLHVLHHAAQEDLCGHWMIEELRHHGYLISPGTLYPMLRAMEKDGWLVSRNDPSGGSRKFYRGTREGRRALEQAKEKLWELFSEVLRPKTGRHRKPRKT